MHNGGTETKKAYTGLKRERIGESEASITWKDSTKEWWRERKRVGETEGKG